MKKYIVLFLLAVSISAHSQNIDSLYTVFSASRGATQIDAANEILKYVHENEYTTTLYNHTNSDDQAFVNATVHAGMASYFLSEKTDFKKSNDFFKLALEYYEKNGTADEIDILNSNIGNTYARIGNYENAVKYYMKCLEYGKSTGHNESLSITLNSLGVIYSQWQKPEMAIRFFEEALEVERPLNRPLNYANRLASLAREYLRIDASKALTLIKEALIVNERIENLNQKEERIAFHTSTMGDIYVEMDSLEKAANCFRQSLIFFETNDRTFNIARTLLALGRLQMKAKQWNNAISSLKRSEEISELYNYLPTLRDACRLLGEAYSNIEPNAMSYFYHSKYSNLNDSIFKETSQQQINDFQVRYETAEKQLEIERQQAEIERQKTRQFIYVSGIVALGLLLTMFAYMVILRTRRNRALTERNNALAEINATKDKFYSIVSHDLKNPAVAQRDAIKILLDNSSRWDSDSVTEYYRKLLKSSNENVELLYTLLNWAKIQTGREVFEPVTFNLVSALQPDISIVKDMAERKNIAFEARMPKSAIIDGDENMLLTVVRNLLTNAVKFTNASGSVTLDISQSGNRYVISVDDTGTGMTQEQIENLFRIDRQHKREGTAGEQSTGLGLIVCRDLLEKHGIVLNVESEVGRGSSFWFEI